MTELPTESEPVRVVEGDCLSVLRGLPDGCVDEVVTSPPYFNAREYSRWPTYGLYSEWAGEVVGEALRVLAPGRMLCIVVSSVISPRPSRNARSARHNLPAMFAAHLERHGAWFAEELVWEKPEGAAVNRSQRFSLDRHPMQWRANATTERILVYQKPTTELNDDIIARHGGADRITGGWDRGEVWRVSPTTVAGHPAPFPVEIPRRLVRYYSWRDELVVDPFGGSGTTAVAALAEGRRCLLIEKSPEYAAIARRRVAEALGRAPGSLLTGVA